jgi:hypothetical protein
MKPLFSFLAFAGLGLAQALTIAVSPALMPAGGGAATVTIGYTDASPTTNLAAAGFTLVLPTGVTFGAVPSSLVMGKTVNFPMPGENGKFLIIGNNPPGNGTMAGNLATIPVVVAGTASGALSFSITGISAANAMAAPVTVAGPMPAVLTVLSKYDLNGDGKLDGTDISLALGQYFGTTTCTMAFNGSPSCAAADVMLVVLAVMGLIH